MTRLFILSLAISIIDCCTQNYRRLCRNVIKYLLSFSDTMTCNSKPLKPNGKLEAPIDSPSSPPRTTLLGTIFSPVFNFFSPATKTGKQAMQPPDIWDMKQWLLRASAFFYQPSISPGEKESFFLNIVLCLLSHSRLRLSRPSRGGRGNHETAGHRAGRRNAEQHSHIHRGHHSMSHGPTLTAEASDDLWYIHRGRTDCHWNRHAPINRCSASSSPDLTSKFELYNWLFKSIAF